MKAEIKISAVWLRIIGTEVQVLVEIDGQWRLAIVEQDGGSYSYCAHASGADGWPLDPITESITESGPGE